MLALIVGAVAAIAGILVGFWLRGASAQGELNAAKSELARVSVESALRAGFEALATEREKTITQLSAEAVRVRAELTAKSEEANRSAALVAELNAKLDNEQKNLAEKLQLLESAKQTLANQFQALAADILDRKSKSFAEGSQKELGTLLDPLKTQIKEFRDKVEEAQRDSMIGRTELKSELNQLKGLNEKLSSEAHNLSTALRQDTQKQGHWGEKILLDILENHGLLKGEHYTYQESFQVDDGENDQQRRRQTDVIVKLPGGRHLIIDSKVTLNAYHDYVKATDDDCRQDCLKNLVRSFREHYKGLAERNYHRISGLQSPDFVVLFAPLEPAFMLAIQNDESLWTDAYERGVLLAGPTTILFVVRIVENLWRQEQQAKNVQRIMDRGEKLYDKFVGFVEDLQAVGASIEGADKSYKEAIGKLTSGRENLVRQVEMLRELGLKPKKKLRPKLLEAAGVEEPGLALAAEAEENELR